MFSKSVRNGLAAFVLGLGLAVSAPAQAATFNISFAQDGVGDAGADWFGTFEAPAGGGLVSLFSALIDGTTYHIPDPDFGPILDPSESFFSRPDTALNASVVLQVALSGTSQISLMLFPNYTWVFGSCDTGGCTLQTRDRLGTYAVGQVPIPAALPLLAAGLGAMGFMGWRRKRRAA